MQPLALRLWAQQSGHLDGAQGILQFPVAAEIEVSGGIDAGGHVGAGQRVDGIEQHQAVRRGGQIATVKEDVGIRRQRIAPAGDHAGIAADTIGVEPGAPQFDSPLRAMGQEVDGVHLIVLLQHARDLLDAVLATIEQHDVQAAGRILLVPQLRQQFLVPVD